MDWYKKIKTASEEKDTLHGQLMKKELERISSKIKDLKVMVSSGGPTDILPRWKGEVRQAIFMLPSTERLPAMSMFELDNVSVELKKIENALKRYSASKFNRMHANGSDNK